MPSSAKTTAGATDADSVSIACNSSEADMPLSAERTAKEKFSVRFSEDGRAAYGGSRTQTQTQTQAQAQAQAEKEMEEMNEIAEAQAELDAYACTTTSASASANTAAFSAHESDPKFLPLQDATKTVEIETGTEMGIEAISTENGKLDDYLLWMAIGAHSGENTPVASTKPSPAPSPRVAAVAAADMAAPGGGPVPAVAVGTQEGEEGEAPGAEAEAEAEAEPIETVAEKVSAPMLTDATLPSAPTYTSHHANSKEISQKGSTELTAMERMLALALEAQAADAAGGEELTAGSSQPNSVSSIPLIIEVPISLHSRDLTLSQSQQSRRDSFESAVTLPGPWDLPANAKACSRCKAAVSSDCVFCTNCGQRAIPASISSAKRGSNNVVGNGKGKVKSTAGGKTSTSTGAGVSKAASKMSNTAMPAKSKALRPTGTVAATAGDAVPNADSDADSTSSDPIDEQMSDPSMSNTYPSSIAVRPSKEDNYYDPNNDPAQVELDNLPPRVVAALNRLLSHLRNPARDAKQKQNDYRLEYVVTALELEAALQMEDHYMNVTLNSTLGPNNAKVRPRKGLVLPEYFMDHSDRAAWNEAESLRLNARSVSDDYSQINARFGMLDTESTGGSFGATAKKVLTYTNGSIRSVEDIQLLDGSDGGFSSSNSVFKSSFQSEQLLSQVQDRIMSQSDLRRANASGRPGTLRELQHDYREKDKKLPALIYSSTLIRESIPMPPQVKPVVEPMKSKHEKKLETLALQKRYQTVKIKGITQQQTALITPVGTVVCDKPWERCRIDEHFLGDRRVDHKVLTRVKKPMKTYTYVTNYLDHVGSVSEYFEEYVQRDKDLRNLNSAAFGSTVSTVEELKLKNQKQWEYNNNNNSKYLYKVQHDSLFGGSISSAGSMGTIGVTPSAPVPLSKSQEMAKANANINKLFEDAQKREEKKKKSAATTQQIGRLVKEMETEGISIDNTSLSMPIIYEPYMSASTGHGDDDFAANADDENNVQPLHATTNLLENNNKSAFWGDLDKSKFFVPRLPEDPNGFLETYGANLIDESDSDAEEVEEEHVEGQGYGKKARFLDKQLVLKRAVEGFSAEDEEDYQEKLLADRMDAMTSEDRAGIKSRAESGFTKEDEEEYQMELARDRQKAKKVPKRLQGDEEISRRVTTQVQIDKFQLKTAPMLWTNIIHPDGMRSFQDDVDAGLERPLTPEPTSDDEDAAFEAEMAVLNGKGLEGDKKGSKAGSIASSKTGSKMGSKLNSQVSSKAVSKQTSQVGSKISSRAQSPSNISKSIGVIGSGSRPGSQQNSRPGSRSASPAFGEPGGSMVDAKTGLGVLPTGALDPNNENDMDSITGSLAGDADGDNSVGGVESLSSLPTIVTEGTIVPDEDDDKIEPDHIIEARRHARKVQVARLRRQRAFEEVFEPTSPAAKLIQARHRAAIAHAEADAAALRTPPKSADDLLIEGMMNEGNEDEKGGSDSDSESDSASHRTGNSSKTSKTNNSKKSLETEYSFELVDPITGMLPGQLLPIFRQHPDASIEHEAQKNIVSGLAVEQGTAIMSRLFKRSVVRLRECMKEPNLIRLVDDPCGPRRDDWATAYPAMQNFKRQLAVVDEALALAPQADATARREFVAFQQVLARKRTAAANKVADYTKAMADCHKAFNLKHDMCIDRLQAAPATKQPKIRNQIDKLKAESDAELKSRGLQLTKLQGEEAECAAYVRGLEVTAIRIIQQWRPLHAKLIQQARLVQFRLRALVKLVAVRMVQRTAKRRLCMYCRGEPETEEEFVLRMKQQKRVNYAATKGYSAKPW